jgi:hypothetical protein
VAKPMMPKMMRRDPRMVANLTDCGLSCSGDWNATFQILTDGLMCILLEADALMLGCDRALACNEAQ